MQTCSLYRPQPALLVAVALLGACLSACSREPRADRCFGFDVYNNTIYRLDSVELRFLPSGKPCSLGGLGLGSTKGMGPLPGPVPDAVDVAWTERASGKRHQAHAQITPLPPPTRTSYMGSVRQIYIVITSDDTVKVFGHCPDLRD